MDTLTQHNIAPDDHRLNWLGAISLHKENGWVQPWRIPYEERALFPPTTLQERAAMPAGVRITFQSTTTSLSCSYEPADDLSPLDMFCDGELIQTVSLAERDSITIDGLSTNDKHFELWLPQHGIFRLRSLTIDATATIRYLPDTRPRWVTYGSSITQCRTAASPSKTWPAIVARQLGLNLTCLGYGGQCHLDPLIAQMIRELPADFLSLCVGINIYGASSLSSRTFVPMLLGFIRIIREKHPTTPCIVMSPIYSPSREKQPNAVNMTLHDVRLAVQEVVGILQSCGDEYLLYIDGLDIFGPDLVHLLPDGLHPDAEGYKRLGYRFIKYAAWPFWKSHLPETAVSRQSRMTPESA